MATDDSARDQLERLWGEHKSTPFPPRLRGKDAGKTNFILLDADIAGCVQALLRRRPLDERRQSILNRRMDHLSIVLPLLTDESESAYRERLRIMGQLASNRQT
jgi:hypothetical protein